MDDSSIIISLGGSSRLSRETGWPLTTIDSWKRSNRIPEWRRPYLAQVARRMGFEAEAKLLSVEPVLHAAEDATAPAAVSCGNAGDLAPLPHVASDGAGGVRC
jgi:hypothetical protein